jgi:BirA family biotin operon repressor/biotin-[acetyl-CoA-carboxylase] ligase
MMLYVYMKHIHISQVESTQIILREELSKHHQNEPVLVSCDDQTQGRGRGNKVWTTLPGTLCFSMNIAPHGKPSFTAIEVAVILARFFETKNHSLRLKWPNDLWNSLNQKCCGILIQTSGEQMLTGIGLNLFSEDKDFGGIYAAPFEIDKKAWSADIASFILANRYETTDSLIRDWEKLCLHLDQSVRITESGESFEGVFEGIGSFGEALLRMPEGLKHLYNGSLIPLGSG